MSLEYLDPETITKALSIAAAVATTAYKLKDVKPRRRATLKADIELLGIAKAQGIESAELGKHIDAELRARYAKTHRARLARRVALTAVGVVWLAGFLAWSVYLSRDGFSPWTLLTGYFALVGLGIAVNGAETGRVRRRPVSGLSATG